MTDPAPSSNPAPRPVLNPAPLWASAFVIAAMIVLQAGRVLPGPATARADMASRVDGFTVMTTSGGSDELLYLLDQRDERLLVYRVINNKRIDLLAAVDVPQMFATAAANAR